MPWWDKMTALTLGSGAGDIGPQRLNQPAPQRSGQLIEGHSPACHPTGGGACQCEGVDLGPRPPDTAGIDDRFYVPYIFIS